MTVTTTAQLDGAAASVPGVSGWSGSGDTHVATVSYSADADYTFTISATDLASNVSDPYATESFTVDQTKPTVEITNIEDRSANNGEVAPVITLNDINFDDYESRMYFDRVLRQAGLFDRLEAMGIEEGDTVSIYDLDFEFRF